MGSIVQDAEVKTYLQIQHADDDAWIAQQVPMAERVFMDKCPNVLFVPTTNITVKLDGGGRALVLRRPVIQIVSVTPDGGDGTALAATDYELEAEAGLLYRADGYAWHKAQRYWQIVYDAGYGTGGYAAVPQNAKLAVLELIARRHSRRVVDLESERIGDWSYKVALEDPLFHRLIAPYSKDQVI